MMILQKICVRVFKKAIYARQLSTCPETTFNQIKILDKLYETDNFTNVTPKILTKLGKNLHTTQNHPLSLVRQRIVNYFYSQFKNKNGNPLFSVYDNIIPIVTTEQNFDSLLVPKNHPSRNKNDCYYINQNTMLRAHTTAHQTELILSGLNNFLIVGDVYRRDQVDQVHFPVFHQIDGVRLCTADEVYKNVEDSSGLKLFETNGIETEEKQVCHTLEAVKIMEHMLKTTLIGLAKHLFGEAIKYRWVNEYFPFTHPSYELEVFHNDKWIEILGCGIMRQEILQNVGVKDRIGWAFGLGLERLAMFLYEIPDIRLFWLNDTGFLNQFKTDNPDQNIQYKPISKCPQCKNDVSFFLPRDGSFIENDFYEIVRECGADMIEQIILIDKYFHPKLKRTSHTYTIVYRSMLTTLTKSQVNKIHTRIKYVLSSKMNVKIR
ncbi:probable phenylalanine--tRNA ligase, mitochondrial [Prorops nasuta]|uniref:probable phenylalanine--tRNA ligase, mitochondrial n=1 Tax=Prorops nasuta TaxID=863751 RepID=UPI0034CD175E